MQPTLRLSYTPTQQDYATVFRFFLIKQTSTIISLATMAIIFLVVVYTIITKSTAPSFFELLWLFIPPLFVVYLLFVQPAHIAKKAAQNEELTSEAMWEVIDSGILISSSNNTTHLEWEALDRLVRSHDYFLIFSKASKNAFRFLPRRAFATQEDEVKFLKLIHEHLK